MHNEVSAPGGVDDAARTPRPGLPRRATNPSRAAAIVIVVGVVISGSTAWTSRTLNRDNERRLLDLETRQAAAVISGTILSISGPLTTALEIAETTGGNAAKFSRYMAAHTGVGRVFISASLWHVVGSSEQQIATVGEAPAAAATSGATRAFLHHAFTTTATFAVMSVQAGAVDRIAYAVAGPGKPFAVYAERAIPRDRRVPVETTSAFADLNYATYLGPTASSAALETTDVSPASLPLSGDTARAAIPFGDTVLTLVATPRVQLGGALGADLPWVFLVGGALLTGASAFGAEELVRRRREAELYASTTSTLYEQLDQLYGEQRTIAESLQRAILPRSNPVITGLEIATRYVAGTDGVDIGGDWYTIVAIDDDHFAFVVGDVSGRGVSAATVMARLRFTIRAYLLEGHSPEVVLSMCSRQLDIEEDGHFATVLIGVGNLSSGEITLANAGHLNPLVLDGSASSFVPTNLGPPLGIAPSDYASFSFTMGPGASFVAFTDGLVERRGESIEVGLQRLARHAGAWSGSPETLVTGLVAGMTASGAEDDVAVLAFQWNPGDR